MLLKRITISILIFSLCISNVLFAYPKVLIPSSENIEYINKNELFLAFYKDFYNYLLDSPEGQLALKESEVTNLDEFYKAQMEWDDGIKGMTKAGEHFGKLFLSSTLENNIETQAEKVGFIGYCFRNDYYVDFINFLSEFFYYFRTGEGLVGRYGEQICNFYYNPVDSAIDTAKFFYFNENTLPSYLTTKEKLIELYNQIPLYKRKSDDSRMSDDKTYIESMKKIVELKESPKSYVFPTLLKQNYFNPNEDDIFGQDADTTAISKVDIDSKNKNYKKISLTFDSSDVATSEDVQGILDILDRYDIKATFFLEYNFVIHNKEIVSKIISKGHEVGNHSTNHLDFKDLTDENIIKEVLINHNLIKRLTGIDMCLFRFPYGSYNERSISLLKQLGYYPIQWTLDSIDWRGEEASVILDRLINSGKIYSGSIVLFHVWPKNTKEVLPSFIDYVNEMGYGYVKLSDLIYKHEFIVSSGRQRLK